MYLPVPPQPDCATAWREAVRLVDAQPGHHAHNVIIDVADPTARANVSDPVVKLVDDFLRAHNRKPVETVANTIFPAALYRRYGAPEFYDRFKNNVLPKVRRSSQWSGYYFERMIDLPLPDGSTINQLADVIRRIREPTVRALNKFELSVFDPTRDVDDSPYGGQCMSFASLKLLDTAGGRQLGMTALYRNHFYIEKLLGNLVGLGRLMAFIAQESGVRVGPLTVVSTHALIDQPRSTTRSDIQNLLLASDQAAAGMSKAA